MMQKATSFSHNPTCVLWHMIKTATTIVMSTPYTYINCQISRYQRRERVLLMNCRLQESALTFPSS